MVDTGFPGRIQAYIHPQPWLCWVPKVRRGGEGGACFSMETVRIQGSRPGIMLTCIVRFMAITPIVSEREGLQWACEQSELQLDSENLVLVKTVKRKKWNTVSRQFWVVVKKRKNAMDVWVAWGDQASSRAPTSYEGGVSCASCSALVLSLSLIPMLWNCAYLGWLRCGRLFLQNPSGRFGKQHAHFSVEG